jgi:DNA repair protein SbcC/Rad50
MPPSPIKRPISLGFPPQATLATLNSYCAAAGAAVTAADPLVKTWSDLERDRAKHEADLKLSSKALEHAREAHLLIEANVPRRHIEAGRHREDSARLAAQLAGTETLQREALKGVIGLTLKAALRHSAGARDGAQVALRQSRKRLADFTTLRDKSMRLGEQLRAIAVEVLEDAANPDECPLCHAAYKPGELSTHIHAGLDSDLEATAQAFHTQVRVAEDSLETANLLHEQVELLIGFAARVGAPSDTVVKAALALLDERLSEHDKIATSLARVEAELRELATRDLTQKRFETAIRELERLGHKLSEQTVPGANALIKKLTKAIEAAQARIKVLAAEIAAVQSDLKRQLGATTATIADAKTLIGRDRERIATTQSLLSKLAVFAQNFPWPAKSSLAELQVSVRSVQSVAAELQTALQREKQKREEHSEALEHKQELDERLAELEPLLGRLISARNTLKDIRENDSLTDAMASALQDNRAAIEAIFSRIHAPPEFEGLGGSFDSLRRKNGQEAPLVQISTGQRAAFALSIFLARNNQANAAPPVMLIDDPIAHIDDFNALSFLDYLRTLAIDRNRQIFFATANDKIAALFERKFDFLGGDFQRFNLTREPASRDTAP